MNWFKFFPALLMASMMLSLTGCASKPPVVNTNVVINFPPEADITSVEQADAALERVALARSQINWRYHQKEQICYDNFFVNHCLLEAKDERRVDLARVKKVEVAANYFKRRSQVEEMDRNLYEKNIANPLPDPATQKNELQDSDESQSTKSLPD
jgi:hypothetical protein